MAIARIADFSLDGLITMFKALFGQNSSVRDAHLLYGAVVARARDGAFFDRFSIPDTFDGRFEMLVMHLFMLHSRLKHEKPAARKVSQLVFDNFIADMDAALREAGVGDPSIPKRLAKMTQVFYGRTGAYEKALVDKHPKSEMAKVIARNLYPNGDAEGRENHLSEYMLSQILDLQNKSVDEIIGQQRFYKGAYGVDEIDRGLNQ